MWKKLTHRKTIIIWKPIAQTLYIKHRLFIMNKATSVQSFTYLGLVVSEENVPKKLTNLTLWGYGLQSPLNGGNGSNFYFLRFLV